jgi:hypothetical protein
MISPCSSQNFVYFDLIKIEPLSIINFSGIPNLDKIFSFKKWISCYESAFLRAITSFHFVK